MRKNEEGKEYNMFNFFMFVIFIHPSFFSPFGVWHVERCTVFSRKISFLSHTHAIDDICGVGWVWKTRGYPHPCGCQKAKMNNR